MHQRETSPERQEEVSSSPLFFVTQQLGAVEHSFRVSTRKRQAQRQLQQERRLEEQSVRHHGSSASNENIQTAERRSIEDNAYFSDDEREFDGGDVIIED